MKEKKTRPIKPYLAEDLLRYMKEARRFDTILADYCGFRSADLTNLQPLHQLLIQDPERKGVAVQDLVESLSLRRPFLTYLLKMLAEQGYIKKKDADNDDPNVDKRVAYMILTDEGEEYCKSQLALYDEKLSKLLDMARTGHTGKYKEVSNNLEKANAYLIRAANKT